VRSHLIGSISRKALYDGHDARLQRVELSRLLALLVPDQGWQRELARRSFTSAYRAVGRRRLPCRKQLLQWRAVRTGILESIAVGKVGKDERGGARVPLCVGRLCLQSLARESWVKHALHGTTVIRISV